MHPYQNQRDKQAAPSAIPKPHAPGALSVTDGASVLISAYRTRREAMRARARGRAMTAATRRKETASGCSEAVPAIDVFHLRCWARAELVAAYLMDFHEAVDGLRAAAVRYGLIKEIGQDAVQAIMAAAFAKVPRPDELEDVIVELTKALDDMPIEKLSAQAESKVAASTLAAAGYLVKQNDPGRLRAWLAKRAVAERLAIKQHLRAKR
jgi:hypothetical protein